MKRIIEIEFDGGTSCNIPRLGYGIGYGSYMIDGGHPVRINHGRAMSANAAEIWTLVRAMESILEAAENPQDIILHVGGDSQIALARCRPKKAKKKTKPCKSSGEFVDSCEALLTCCAQFAEVVTRWRSRAVSVHLFGH